MNPISPFEPNAEPDPRRFEGSIVSDQNDTIGGWEAFLCSTKNDLREHLHLDVLGLVDQIPYPGTLWPIAYLKSLYVLEDFWNEGHGSAALRRFHFEASNRNAVIGLTRIGWQCNSLREKNIRFYENSGWKVFFENDECEAEKQAPFAYFDLRYLNR